MMMPAIILGGIYGGIMTPTEAAGVAVIYAIPIAIYVY
jgi:TRAP-type C4-dicarboxylate transport system permease large subunit